jgi:hypothetical protein
VAERRGVVVQAVVRLRCRGETLGQAHAQALQKVLGIRFVLRRPFDTGVGAKVDHVEHRRVVVRALHLLHGRASLGVTVPASVVAPASLAPARSVSF